MNVQTANVAHQVQRAMQAGDMGGATAWLETLPAGERAACTSNLSPSEQRKLAEWLED